MPADLTDKIEEIIRETIGVPACLDVDLAARRILALVQPPLSREDTVAPVGDYTDWNAMAPAQAITAETVRKVEESTKIVMSAYGGEISPQARREAIAEHANRDTVRG